MKKLYGSSDSTSECKFSAFDIDFDRDLEQDSKDDSADIDWLTF